MVKAKKDTKKVEKKVKPVKSVKDKQAKKESTEKTLGVTMGIQENEYVELADRNVQSMFTTILGGAPGFQRGVIYELYGAEGTGKTATSM